MWLLITKLMSREPKKTMGFIRDISVAIILLLSVGAVFTTINIQISFLFGLAGTSDTISIRDVQHSVEQSYIPVSLENDLEDLDSVTVLSLVYLQANISYLKNDLRITQTSTLVFTNISLLTDYNLISSLSKDYLLSFSKNEGLIGSVLAEKMNLTSKDLPVQLVINQEKNISVYIKDILFTRDLYQNTILLSKSQLDTSNLGYNGSYISELFIKPNFSGGREQTLFEVKKLIATNSGCNNRCNIIEGTGSTSLISIIINKLTQNLNIFFQILDFLIFIRLFQAILWIGKDFKYELNLLKIYGASPLQLLLSFIIIGFVIGNLSIVLGLLGILIIPVSISLFLSIITASPVVLSVPNEIELVSTIIWLNFLFFFSSLYPGLKLAREKVMTPRTREI